MSAEDQVKEGLRKKRTSNWALIFHSTHVMAQLVIKGGDMRLHFCVCVNDTLHTVIRVVSTGMPLYSAVSTVLCGVHAPAIVLCFVIHMYYNQVKQKGQDHFRLLRSQLT